MVYALAGLRPYVHQAESMTPTLSRGTRLWVDALAPRWRAPRRGELWTYVAPRRVNPKGETWVHRVIGLPGETVEVVPRRLLVDGRAVVRLMSAWDYGDGVPLAEGDPGSLIRLQGSEARIRTDYEQPLIVRALPSWRIQRLDDKLIINGRTAFEFDEDSPAQVVENLREFGGDPTLKAAAVIQEAEPALILVRGERLSLDEPHVLINGKPLDEPYVGAPPDYADGPRTLGAGEFYLLGDNRSNSRDSHDWGPLPRARFRGRVLGYGYAYKALK